MNLKKNDIYISYYIFTGEFEAGVMLRWEVQEEQFLSDGNSIWVK